MVQIKQLFFERTTSKHGSKRFFPEIQIKETPVEGLRRHILAYVEVRHVSLYGRLFPRRPLLVGIFCLASKLPRAIS